MISNSVNLILQGKGGVGKSFVSSMLAQYFLDYKNIDFIGADTDPVNKSFAGIDRLNVAQINIMENMNIIQSKFDDLFERIINLNESTFVIDNGAATFPPLIKYIDDNGIIDMFDEMERPVFIHSIIVGGQSGNDTLQGLLSLFELIEKSRNVNLIIWLNEFQGNINFDKKIEKMIANKVAGKVTIKNWNSDAFSSDIERMTQDRLTLQEVMESSEFNLMAKNRLKRVFNDVYIQLDSIFDISENDVKNA